MADLSDIQTIEHDVVVIGAGGAGLRAATECGLLGLNTGLVCKPSSINRSINLSKIK